jgi:hypothetical protein
MAFRFKKHYTRDEASALLPQVRVWLDRLQKQKIIVDRLEPRVGQWVQAGQDAGGSTVNQLLSALAVIKGTLQEFEQREIHLKDLERGLVDFPAVLAGREVFLCWEQDEPNVEYWHDLESGFAGRERL